MTAIDDSQKPTARRRLDETLVARGLVASRARARDLVKRGLVQVAGVVVTRPALAVADRAAITVAGPEASQVSRGAEKLRAALAAFALSLPGGAVALDLGASTGGFTEVLMAHGAGRVYAVDVGRAQLHPRLATDPRVVSLEGIDARELDSTLIPQPVHAITADLSFISLVKALPAALQLAAPGGWLVALVKPQFEVGRAAVGKGGIVRDAAARDAAVEHVRAWLASQPGWSVIGVVPSPITGGSGNVEYLIGARHDH